jgi:MFS-type transporter involved in bile tolerance (Atg22 family)
VQAGKLGQVSWALFEWARNPYYIVIYIYGPYFTNEVIGDPVRGQEIWDYANGFAGRVTACFAPFLGAIADKVGRRLRLHRPAPGRRPHNDFLRQRGARRPGRCVDAAGAS